MERPLKFKAPKGKTYQIDTENVLIYSPVVEFETDGVFCFSRESNILFHFVPYSEVNLIRLVEVKTDENS